MIEPKVGDIWQSERRRWLRTITYLHKKHMVTIDQTGEVEYWKGQRFLYPLNGRLLQRDGNILDWEFYDYFDTEQPDSYELVCGLFRIAKVKEEPYKLFKLNWGKGVYPSIKDAPKCIMIGTYIEPYRIIGYTDDSEALIGSNLTYDVVPCDKAGNRKYALGRKE